MTNASIDVVTGASVLLIVLSTTRVIPRRILKVFALNVVICLVGWELWMTYGLVDGDPVSKRVGKDINPFWNMLKMSAGDGLVGVLQVEAAVKAFGLDAFKKWNWKTFGVIFGIGMIQNIAVTVALRKRLVGANLSVAPMMPVKASGVIQNQEAWVIQPFILYALLIKYRKVILGVD